MKKLLLTLSITLLSIVVFSQNVGIGTNTPNASAKLDISSTNSGLLPPRMTFAQRAAIVNPAQGLIVYCTDCVANGELSVFNGVEWKTAFIGSTVSDQIPLAPLNLSVSISSPLAYAALSWTDQSTNENGFKVEKKINAGIFTLIGNTGVNNTYFIDSNVNQNTTYTYRLYSYNNAGNSLQYSNEVQKSIGTLPALEIIAMYINDPYSGICEFLIQNTGGSFITETGFVWSTSANPTIDLSTKTVDGSGTGIFTSYISGLTPNTTYHLRAYATNSVGTAYSADSVFTTLPILLPIVSTTAITNIAINNATSGGEVTFDGNLPITERGVVWSTSANPTIALSTKTVDGSSTGSFISSITGLTSNTTYHVRAYATNIVGTAYGDDISFTTSFKTIFNYGPWTGDCITNGVQRRGVVSTDPADSFNIAYPPIDSIIRICPATAATFPGTYKITADTLFTKLAGTTTYDAGADIYSDTSWNPSESLDDYYVFNANGSFTYNEGGTPVPAGSGTNFLSYPYSNSLGSFATGWSLQSGFLVYAPEANFGVWGYFEKIIPTEFVLNYSFTNPITGNKYIQSTTYTKQP